MVSTQVGHLIGLLTLTLPLPLPLTLTLNPHHLIFLTGITVVISEAEDLGAREACLIALRVPEAMWQLATLSPRDYVCHTGLEPRTSRTQAGLLLTRLSLALDRARSFTSASAAVTRALTQRRVAAASRSSMARRCQACRRHGSSRRSSTRPPCSQMSSRITSSSA